MVIHYAPSKVSVTSPKHMLDSIPNQWNISNILKPVGFIPVVKCMLTGFIGSGPAQIVTAKMKVVDVDRFP